MSHTSNRCSQPVFTRQPAKRSRSVDVGRDQVPAGRRGARFRTTAAVLLLSVIFGAGRGRSEEASAQRPAAEVRLERAAQMGCADCEGPRRLAPAYLAVKPNGGVYVVDEFEPFVRVFDGDGGLKQSLGPAGEGPGELGSSMPGPHLQHPIGLYFEEDGSFLVHDLMPERLSRFDANGQYLETVTLPTEVRFPIGRGYDASRRRLFSASTQLAMFTEKPGPRIDRFDLADPVPVPVLSEPEDVLSGTAPDWGPGRDFPLAVNPTGGFVIGDPWEYRIRVFDSDGTPVGEFGRDVALPPWAEGELAERLAGITRGRPANAGQRREPLSHKPHFEPQSFDYDSAGRLWVRTLRGGGEETIFDVFDASGGLLAEVVLRARIMSGVNPATKPFDVSGEFLAAAIADSTGNEFVGVWRIVWQ